MRLGLYVLYKYGDRVNDGEMWGTVISRTPTNNPIVRMDNGLVKRCKKLRGKKVLNSLKKKVEEVYDKTVELLNKL